MVGVTWRLYARRVVSGQWLSTDVPMQLSLTWALGGDCRASGSVPWPFTRKAQDGLPYWLERGTALYAEEDGVLSWVGLVDYSRPTKTGVAVEFKGLASAYDLIPFTGVIRQWRPNPYTIVGQLVANAHSQVDGNAGFVVTSSGTPASLAGDPTPPPRPVKPKRKKHETADHYKHHTLFNWSKKVDDWQEKYGSRKPYSLANYEAKYVGAEIASLADETPFQWVERHTWADRSTLTPRHELALSRVIGRRRTDVAILEGVNVAEVLEPQTDTTRYGNQVVALGAGEGSAMRAAAATRRDNRLRTTRFVDHKAEKSTKRLNAYAQAGLKAAVASVTLEAASLLPGALTSVRVGDELRVQSARFTGWCRVSEVTRSTGGGNVSLSFSATTSGTITT